MRISSLLFLLPALAFAHGGGHGPKIEGHGPSGGILSSVILAKDAELGEKAKAQAVAEWKIDKKSLAVSFWNQDRSKSVAASATEFKWILLGKRLKKPIVVNGSGSVLKHDLKDVDMVELILPGLGGSSEKHVTMVEIR